MRFSALQRAENSSLVHNVPLRVAILVSVLFSEPKIPHRPARRENRIVVVFQCSSASRKFLTLLNKSEGAIR